MRSEMVLCGRWWAGVVMLLVLSFSSTHAHIPVNEDDERIEATPVLVMAADPSTPRLLGFLRLPPEGSGGQPGGGPAGAWSRNTLWLEGSGAGRFKREYSLEDFLIWMPSGDGSTEEWQHRPRDTSWMREGIITTTVFLTTTVYTTVLRPPLITPSTVTSTHSSTKSAADLISSSNTPNTAPDKGGGKELGDTSETGTTTVSYDIANCNNQTNTLEGSQSDYPHSGGSGNQLPETSKEKNKNTQHKGEKTNYITVTQTIMTAPPNLYTTRPPSLTTTTTRLTEALYDETDLVRSSIEYLGPSATFPALSATPILSSTYPPRMTVTINPVTGTTAINTHQSSSSDFHGSVAPTATFSGGTGEFPHEGIQSTPELPDLMVTTGIQNLSSNTKYSTPGTSMSPILGGSGNETESSEAGSVSVGATLDFTTERDTTENSAGVSKSKEGAETSTGGDTGTETKTEAGLTISVTEQGSENNFGVPIGEGITETNLGAPGNEATTVETNLNIPMTEGKNIGTEAPSGLEETQDAPGNGRTRDPNKDFATTTLTTLVPSTHSHQLPADTFRPLFERNSTVFHEIELFDLTTPTSGRNDSIFWGPNTDEEGTVNGTSDMDYPGFVINESDIFFNASDGIHGTQLPDQDPGGSMYEGTSSNEATNSTFGLEYPEAADEGVGSFSNASDNSNKTRRPGQDADGDQGSIKEISPMEPTIPEHGFGAPEGVTSTMSAPELIITLGSDPELLVTAGRDVEFSATTESDPGLSITTESGPELSITTESDPKLSITTESNLELSITTKVDPQFSITTESDLELFITTDSDSDLLSTTESDLKFTATAGSVEVVDLSPEGPEEETVAAPNSEENITWVDTLITTPTDSPNFTTVSGEDTGNTSTSANGLDKEIFKVPFETDDPYMSTTLFPPLAGKGGGVDGTADNDSTFIILPGVGPQVDESESESSGAEDSPGGRTGRPEDGGKDNEEAIQVHPSSGPPSSSHGEESEDTLQISPSKTVTPLFSSGVESSMSERPLTVKPSQAMPPTTVVSSSLAPDVLGPSPSQPDDALATTSTIDGEPATFNPQLTLPTDTSTDGSMLGTDSSDGVVSLISTFTGTTETVIESSPDPSPSQEASTEDPETTATYVTSLTGKLPGTHEPSATLGERATPTWPSSTESEFPVLTHTSIHVASTTTMPVSVTITTSREMDMTSTLSTTTLPVIHTTVKSVSISITTDKSPLTSPSGTIQGTPWATEPTLGPQPSAPSPSNNATVPLDQRYWVRTVLEGAYTEDTSHLYWVSMENKLTDVYKIAYERDVARQLGAGEVNMVALASTESPGTTTRDPYENYTTIIARVKREVAGMPNAEPTLPTVTFLAEQDTHNTHQDTRIASTKFKIALGLHRMRILPHIFTAMTKNKKPAITKNKKILNTHGPSDNVLVNIRRKRELIRESKQDPARQWRPPPSLYLSAKVHKRSASSGNVKVRLHNITYDNTTDLTELVYTVFDGEEPILARDAVTNMSKVDDMEMAVILDQVVKIKAEEYLQSPSARQDGVLVYGIIGAVVGAMMLLVFLAWLTVFLYNKSHKRDELQPDSEAASPRSQLSANAYSGHINMAFTTPREEKLEGEPLPSTSHGFGNGLGHASPTGSYDNLISRPKQGPSLGPSKARVRRRLQYGQQKEEGEEGEGDDEAEEGGGSRRASPKEDYDTTEDEEATDGQRRRPKSSMPWRRPGRHVGHAITEEPVYSSPNPANIQYQPSHSTYSKYDTTHSELTSSDVHCDPTHQLMANTQHSASLFTHKDEGSVFLPPPPKGFGNPQDSLFIPGTSLPRFLPPPRLYKQAPNTLGQRTPSQIDAYDYDPEAPPIPPRNYSREEAGLPPMGQELKSPPRPHMKDAQVEAQVESDALTQEQERDRRPSASLSQVSADSGGSESSTAPHIGRLRRRFHDLLDDAFSLLNGQRPRDRVTPLTTPSPSRKGRSRSAAMQYRGGEVGEEGEGGAARPWSATAFHASPPAWRDAQVVGVVPLNNDRSPKSAWGDGAGRASARPGSARPGSARPGSARPGSARPNSGRSARSITPVNHPPSPDRPDGVSGGAEEPLDPETGLRSSDPAVPLIRAIKEELRRFKSSISTESSTA